MSKPSETVIIEGTVLLGDQLVKNQMIRIEGGKISEIGSNSNIPANFAGKRISVPQTHIISPGFIDLHIHGANGSDTMDATIEALNNMAVTLVKEGTTSFLPTTMTQKKEAIEDALKTAAEYIANHNGPGKTEALGVHLEGPFINPKRKGAQPEEYVVPPSVTHFDEWQKLSGGNIRIVTLAPEMENGLELTSRLKETDVIASIGHSDADYVDVKEAAEAGASHITHLYNGMKGLHHREPGTAGGALLLNELLVEIISDGYHIRPEMIDLAIRLKGTDKAILVTDAMRAKWLEDGESELGGQTVIVRDGKATLEDGTLAGSILKMNDAVKNIMEFANISLPEALKLATINPAKEIGVDDRKGSIALGKDADLVVLDENLTPAITICRGVIAYERMDR